MSTYEEYTEYLFSQVPMFQNVGSDAYKEGLENTHILDEHFGHPHTKFHTIHIAGTNGKGSCSHTIASILQEAGYKVGLFTSPHLTDFRERIRVNGEMISKQYVMDFVKQERSFFEPLYPSFFEVTTALAFKYFRDQQVLETNTDVTNVLAGQNPVWMEPNAGYRIKVSLDWLRGSDEGLSVLREVRSRQNNRGNLRKKLADPLDESEMSVQNIVIPMVDQTEMKNAFMATSTDLFYYVMNYSYPYEIDLEGKLVLFCQLASQFSDEFEITDKYEEAYGFEYPLIYPK